MTARAAEPRAAIDRRAQILEAARSVLSRQGYAETSMKDIAAEAGVAPGLLHYYFESKEEILFQVVEGLSHEIGESHRSAVQGVADPLEAIAAAMESAAERCSPGFCRLLLDAYSLAWTNPGVRERLRLSIDETVRSTVVTADEVTAGLGAAGEALPVTTQDLAIALVGAMDGVALLTTLRGDDPTGAYRALKALVLSYAAIGAIAAGKEPPLAKLADLVSR